MDFIWFRFTPPKKVSSHQKNMVNSGALPPGCSMSFSPWTVFDGPLAEKQGVTAHSATGTLLRIGVTRQGLGLMSQELGIWGFVSHHRNKNLLEMTYPLFSWVMWKIGTSIPSPARPKLAELVRFVNYYRGVLKMADPCGSPKFPRFQYWVMVDHDLDDLELARWLWKPRNSLSRNMGYGNRELLDDFGDTNVLFFLSL